LQTAALATWLCRPESPTGLTGLTGYFQNEKRIPKKYNQEILFILSKSSGAGNGTRTRDNHVGNVELYQLSYSRPVKCYSIA